MISASGSVLRFLSPGVMAVFTVAGLAGCSLDMPMMVEDAAPASRNECSSNSGCSAGSCSARGMCEAESTSLSTILLEITPPAGTDTIAGVRYTQVVDVDSSTDVELPHISRVQFVVSGTPIASDSCVGDLTGAALESGAENSLHARTTFVPRERLLGLPNPSQSGEALVQESGVLEASFAVPPGHYDFYVEPLANDAPCYRPPFLVLDQEIASGDVALRMALPSPQRLDVLVRFPGLIDVLGGWSLDVVDRVSGRLLSNRVVLGAPQVVESLLEYRGRLAFLPVQAQGEGLSAELLRLSPPEDVTAPTVYFERTVVELFQDGMGVIDQLASLPAPVLYTGRVNRAGGTQPAPSSVTLVAKSLTFATAGIITEFSRTIKTNVDGVFEAELLPGTYVVQVQPIEDGLGQLTQEMTVGVASDVQAGQVLEVVERPRIGGRLLSAAGRPVALTPVDVFPLPRAGTFDVIDIARGKVPLVPRGQGGTTAEDGSFSLLSDAGVYHLVARPEAGSGFPWGFLLGVEVSGESPKKEVSLRLPLPFAMEGELSSNDIGSVPSALIRAYALLDGETLATELEKATSVVAIGEARVDPKGHFALLLPATFP